MAKSPELRDAAGFVIVRVPMDIHPCSNCGIGGTCLAFDNSESTKPEIFLCRVCISMLYDGLIKVEVWRGKQAQREALKRAAPAINGPLKSAKPD